MLVCLLDCGCILLLFKTLKTKVNVNADGIERQGIATKRTIKYSDYLRETLKKLQKQYEHLLLEALRLQRKGDIMGYSMKIQEAELIREQILALQN